MEPILTHFFLKTFLFFAVFTASTIYLTRNPVYSLISLILTFLFSGAFLITLSQDFLGITLVIVYVGAITVLLLFVIMTLNIRRYEKYNPIYKEPLRLITIVVFISFLYFGVSTLSKAMNSSKIVDHLYKSFYMNNIEFPNSLYFMTTDNILSVGNYLYTHFFVLFLIAGLILFIAMIGALLIAQDDKVEFKKQNAFKQINRNPKKCLTLYSNK